METRHSTSPQLAAMLRSFESSSSTWIQRFAQHETARAARPLTWQRIASGRARLTPNGDAPRTWPSNCFAVSTQPRAPTRSRCLDGHDSSHPRISGHSVPFPMWTGAFTQPAPALASADDACAVLSAAGLADAALVLRAFRPRDPARTPLHWAAAAGHAKAVEVLLEAGARDVVDSSGNGALHLGALRLDAPVLKALLAADAGRVRDARNRAGHTPLALALTRASKLARGIQKGRDRQPPPSGCCGGGGGMQRSIGRRCGI